MVSIRPKMTTLTIPVAEKAKATMERQARAQGVPASLFAGQLFDIGFAAVCAREKSMPVTDSDLDAICGATLLLWARGAWNTAEIAKGLGVPEPTIIRILEDWRTYRRASL